MNKKKNRACQGRQCAVPPYFIKLLRLMHFSFNAGLRSIGKLQGVFDSPLLCLAPTGISLKKDGFCVLFLFNACDLDYNVENSLINSLRILTDNSA